MFQMLYFLRSRYLQEIGYTDTIIDVRSNRVRSLLGLGPGLNANDRAEDGQGGTVNGVGATGSSSLLSSSSPGGADQSGNSKRLSETQGRRAPAKKIPPASLAEAMIMDTEAAVMANFDFLAQEGVGVEVDDEDDMSDDMDDTTDDDSTDDGTTKRIKSKNKVRNLPIDNFERRTNSF